MTSRALIISSIIFFLFVNTSRYWEGKTGGLGIPIFLLLVIYFVVLAVLTLIQLYTVVVEKFKNKKRLLPIGITAAVLTSAFFFPRGFIDFEKYEKPVVLLAQREGSANCMMTLKLREDNSFVEREVCFGITENKGTYILKGDTIFFENTSIGRGNEKVYRFAVIKRENVVSKIPSAHLLVFRNDADTTGIIIPIVRNTLIK